MAARPAPWPLSRGSCPRASAQRPRAGPTPDSRLPTRPPAGAESGRLGAVRENIGPPDCRRPVGAACSGSRRQIRSSSERPGAMCVHFAPIFHLAPVTGWPANKGTRARVICVTRWAPRAGGGQRAGRLGAPGRVPAGGMPRLGDGRALLLAPVPGLGRPITSAPRRQTGWAARGSGAEIAASDGSF